MKNKSYISPAFSLFILLLILTFTSIKPVVIHGKSMEPLLEEDSIQLFYSGILNYIFPVHKGDIILFKDPSGNKKLVKQIVLRPGESICLEEGYLVLDKKQIVLTYEQYKRLLDEKAGPMSLFVLGNNLYNSRDSRDFGYIEKKDIIGRYLSWNKADHS